MRRSWSRRPSRSCGRSEALALTILTHGYSIVALARHAAARERGIRPALSAPGIEERGRRARLDLADRRRGGAVSRVHREAHARASARRTGRERPRRRRRLPALAARPRDQRVERARGARGRILLGAVLRVPRRPAASVRARERLRAARALARGAGCAARHARAHPPRRSAARRTCDGGLARPDPPRTDSTHPRIF